MANVTIYSNVNNTSRTLTFDFVGDVLAADDSTFTANTASCSKYYFKITTGGAVQDNDVAFRTKVVRGLSELALNGTAATRKQSASNTGSDYTDIKTMIIDYTYDYVSGHTANQFASGCTEQRPMKFT